MKYEFFFGIPHTATDKNFELLLLPQTKILNYFLGSRLLCKRVLFKYRVFILIFPQSWR
jgi:hypothetical protein